MREMALILPTLPLPLMIAAYFAAGVAAGWAYFVSVRHSAAALAASSSPFRILLEALLRFGLLGGALLLVSWQGALPLLAATAGIIVARQVLLRSGRENAQ